MINFPQDILLWVAAKAVIVEVKVFQSFGKYYKSSRYQIEKALTIGELEEHFLNVFFFEFFILIKKEAKPQLLNSSI